MMRGSGLEPEGSLQADRFFTFAYGVATQLWQHVE
jgi:hypothetical protein